MVTFQVCCDIRVEMTDPLLEKQVSDWLEAVTCMCRDGHDFQMYLRSGEVLCILANEVKSGSIKKINKVAAPDGVVTPLMSFKMRENISLFIRFCREICELAENDLFSTDDLFDAKDMKTVVLCLWNLGGVVQGFRPDLPTLGLVSEKRRGSTVKSFAVTRPPMLYPKELDEKPLRVEAPVVASGGGQVAISVESAGSLEAAVQLWLEAILGRTCPADETLYSWLRSGEVLCDVYNNLSVEPAIVAIVRGSEAAPFKQRENISKFIRACRGVGVHEADLFTSVDLFEGKNFYACLSTVYALGGVLQGVKGDCRVVLGKRQQPARPKV